MSNQSLGGTVSQFQTGARLVTEGEESRKMFIIKKGKVRVFKTYMGQKVTLAVLGAGEVFGELSFFDAEPRSASVEALTELTAIVISGNDAQEGIAGLPPWVFRILRTTFHRFREADQKIAILQSMNEYQKRAFKTDSVGKTVYIELLRFNKTLKLLYKSTAAQGPVQSSSFYRELDEMLGNRMIGLWVFWKQLKEYDIINNNKEEIDKIVEIDFEGLESWNEYLLGEVNSERYLLLSHTSIAVLRRIIGFTQADGLTTRTDPDGLQKVTYESIRLREVPLYADCLNEFDSKKLIRVDKEAFYVDPIKVSKLYLHQSLLKAFDHTTMNVD